LAPSASIADSSRAPSATHDLVLLCLLFALVYFLPAGFRPLTNPDEGRYTEIAREMAVTGDYISPRLNGVLFFEKPPLFYWLEAGAESLGGQNLWVLRFWPIALALLGSAAVYGTARVLWGRPAGWWSAIILSTSLLYYGIGQIVILDMAVSVFLTWSLCAFVLAVRAPPSRQRRLYCWALYASMALALLTKGLIGLVIPLAIIFLWLLFLNKWRELRHAHLYPGLLILLALALPWHIAAAIANPPAGGWSWAHFFSKSWYDQGFLWYYFVREHFLRYLDPGTEHRNQPWWFFSLILTAGFLPWTFFLPSAVANATKGGWLRLKNEPELVFLLLWALFPLAFFSISSSKLIPYIVPSLPPLALLTGCFIARAQEAPDSRALIWPMRSLAIFCALIGAGISIYTQMAAHPPVPVITLNGLAAFLELFAFYLIYNAFNSKVSLAKSLHGLILFVLVFLVIAIFVTSQVLNDRKPSTAPAATWLRPRLQSTDQVFTLWDYGPYQDFAPLLNRTIGVAGHIPDEQEFGLMLEAPQQAARYPGLVDYLALRRTNDKATPMQVLATQMPPFLKILQGPARVYVLVDTAHFVEFQKDYASVTIFKVWNDSQFVIFSNQHAGSK
jgi:4-amino-4-deoxy-L-arabinose transferase-like glycosyltransferase